MFVWLELAHLFICMCLLPAVVALIGGFELRTRLLRCTRKSASVAEWAGAGDAADWRINK